jgi:hypothetical protein
MTYLKLSRLSHNNHGELQENVLYVNPQHIRLFSEEYSESLEMFVTAISWANSSYIETYVKETPYQIEQQLHLS